MGNLRTEITGLTSGRCWSDPPLRWTGCGAPRCPRPSRIGVHRSRDGKGALRRQGSVSAIIVTHWYMATKNPAPATNTNRALGIITPRRKPAPSAGTKAPDFGHIVASYAARPFTVTRTLPQADHVVGRGRARGSSRKYNKRAGTRYIDPGCMRKRGGPHVMELAGLGCIDILGTPVRRRNGGERE